MLVVCHGNICRSPLAGVALSRVLGEESVRSRGFGEEGKRAAKKVRVYAAEHGYDLENHRSQQVTQEDICWCSVCVYMDAGNLRRLIRLKVPSDKLYCLGWALGQTRISDPNYVPKGSKTDKILDNILDAVSKWLRERR